MAVQMGSIMEVISITLKFCKKVVEKGFGLKLCRLAWSECVEMFHVGLPILHQQYQAHWLDDPRREPRTIAEALADTSLPSLSERGVEKGTPDGWQETRKTFFAYPLLPTNDIASMYDDSWEESHKKVAQGEALWRTDLAIKVDEKLLFEAEVERFDKGACASVSDAIKRLNSFDGHVACPEGFCAVYSNSSSSYWLLRRCDKEVKLEEIPAFWSEFRTRNASVNDAALGAESMALPENVTPVPALADHLVPLSQKKVIDILDQAERSFRKFDRDNSGTIEALEVERSLKMYLLQKTDISAEDLTFMLFLQRDFEDGGRSWMKKVDVAGKGYITLKDLMVFVIHNQNFS